MARIRIKEGLSYGGNAQLQVDEIDESAGWLSYWIYAPQNRDKLEAAFKEEVARALSEGFTEQELVDAKSGWMQSRTVSRAQDKEVVRSLARKSYFGRSYAWDADLEKRVQALDPAAIRASLAKHIHPEKLTIIRAGDFAKAASAPAAAPAPAPKP
jgi:zinc protease